MMVGEQPGDREDVEGHPFVGPAGRLLDQALEQSGIARDDVYLTNVVEALESSGPAGKQRIHTTTERRGGDGLQAVARAESRRRCRPAWRCARQVVELWPGLRRCYGRSFRVSRQRGQLAESELAPIAHGQLVHAVVWS